MTVKKIKNQNEWDLSPLTRENFSQKRKQISTAHQLFIKKWQKRSDWLKNPVILKKALDEFADLSTNYTGGGPEAYYYWLRSELEEANTEVKAKYNQINDFSLELSNQLQFFELSLARLPQKLHNKFLSHPKLQDYRHFLEKLFAQSPYLLSDREEKIIRLKEQSSYANWVKLTSSFLAVEKAQVLLENGQVAVKPFSEIYSILNSRQKSVRDKAAKATNNILEKNIKIGENELNSILANKKVDDELRGLKRPDLSRHLHDDISSSAVDSMLSVVAANFSLPKKYYQLKAKLLKVKKLKYHERGVPIGTVDRPYNYSQAKALLEKVLLKLDPEFQQIFRNFDQNGQIDVYPKIGKRSGAFCVAESLARPTFILLNHDNKLHGALTLAHEVGHGINNELMRRTQNALNFGTTLATAEVASTFFEDFILKSILEEADEETRLEIMMEKLNQDMNTIFRQSALYLFEQELHRDFRAKGYLSSDEIGALFQKHMSAYMGPAVEQPKNSKNWWLHWIHIRSFFYVYSYASGLLISKYLQGKVTQDQKFVGQFKYFLSAGLSEPPQDIFRNLGININDRKFWQQGVREVADLLQATEELARKLNKI